MRASFSAMLAAVLIIATFFPNSAAAQYPYQSMPSMSPQAGGGGGYGYGAHVPVGADGYAAYPPGAYPPGAYPPGAYPAGAYPAGAYPPGHGAYPPGGPPASVPLNDGFAYPGDGYYPDDAYLNDAYLDGAYLDDGYLDPGDGFVDDYGPAGEVPYAAPLPPAQSLFAGPPPLWTGYLASSFIATTERSLWDGDLLLPILQDGRSLWYWDLRGQADNDSGGKFNVGTGVRTLARPGLVFGTYIFYDRLFSSHDNEFNQGTFGVEVMDFGWDARFNVYLPDSKAKNVGAPVETVQDGEMVTITKKERAYWGFDLEAGWLMGTWGPNAQHELRSFIAVYHFDNSEPGYDNITGPRFRMEWRYYDIPMFGNGSRLLCGFSVQADDERGGDATAFIGLRVPLDLWAHSRPPLSPLHRRMVDPIIREVDIISRTQRFVTDSPTVLTAQPVNNQPVIKDPNDLN